MIAGQEPSSSDRDPAGECATVLASLPNGMFRLKMPDGREVVAHAAQDLRKAFTRLIAGDQVLVQVSPFDRSKARISQHLKLNVSQPLPPIHPNKRELS